MNFSEGIRLALAQLRQDKLKSAFGLLGVVIGVFFLIIVVSVVEGVDRYVTEDLASEFLGINTIQVRRIPQVQIEVDPAQRREWNRRPRLRVDDANAIREGLTVPALVGVESGTSAEVRGPRGRAIDNVQLSLISHEILAIRRMVVFRGRPFSPQEADLGVPVVILGSAVADALFQGVDPLGGRVRISGFPFRVVGVLEARGNVFGQSLDNVAIVPAESPAQAFLARPGNVNGIVIQALDPADIPVALGEAEAALRVERRLRPSEPSDFELETADDSLAFWNRISTVLFLALPGLVGISLVVGGIVIMNIMLVSVIERTREVGVRMALGARRSDILTQFVIEAAFLSGTGSLLGAGVGIAVTSVVQATTPLPAAVAAHWVAIGILLGVSVGLVAGVYPAVRASRMDPVEALRYE